MKLTVADTVITYNIKKSKRAKHLRITISHEGVVVVAPLKVKEDQVTRFIESKKDWIHKHYLKQRYIPYREFVSGEKLPCLGEEIILRIQHVKCKRTRVILEGNNLVVIIHEGLSQREQRDEVQAALERWYKQTVRKAIINRLNYFNEKLRVQFGIVRIKSQKTRWGSCSRKGNLNFNWRLAMAPEHIIDYVVVHELCHLVYMNHSKEFWRLVESQIPDYKDKRKWLKDNGFTLRL